MLAEARRSGSTSLVLAVLFASGCSAAPAPIDGSVTPTLDGATADADGGRSLVDPRRPPGYRTLHPTCGSFEYDVEDHDTYDTPDELAVAMSDARCAGDLRCAWDRAGSCDPFSHVSSYGLHAPIDLELAERCLRALAEGSCDAEGHRAADDICRGLDRGAIPDGEACASDRSCISGHCRHPDEVCGGTCEPALPCDDKCPSGEWCEDGVCRPPGRVGDPCTRPLFPGVPTLPTCAEGLACDGLVCVAGPEVGDACTVSDTFGFSDSCAPELSCEAGHCRTRPLAGEPCIETASWGSLYTFCAGELVCFEHVCTAPIVVTVGEACGTTRLCPAGADCVEPARTCMTRPARGEPCRVDGVCADGSYCSDSGVCASLVGPGCACDAEAACPFRFRCVEGRCERVGVVPTPCSSLEDCGGYACEDGLCSVRTIGESCSDTEPCDEGTCRRNGLSERCRGELSTGASCSGDPYGCGGGQVCGRTTRTCDYPDGTFDPCREPP